MRFGFEDVQWVTEIARNDDQFAMRLLLDRIGYDQKITEPVKDFADKAGIDLEEVERLSNKEERDTYLPSVPLDIAEEYNLKYSGEFPFQRGEKVFNIEEACSYEIPENIAEKVENKSEWLGNFADQEKRFTTYLESKDFNRAWLCLNSHGWDLNSLKHAISELANRANNPLFCKLAAAYVAIPEGDSLL